MTNDVYLLEPRDAVAWKGDLRLDRAVTGDKNWTGENAPAGTAISYYLASAASNVTIQITDPLTGDAVRDLEGTGNAGLNRVQWDLSSNPDPDDEDDDEGPPVGPGTYRVTLRANGMERSALVEVLEDIWMFEMR
jgi:hypothetical protein